MTRGGHPKTSAGYETVCFLLDSGSQYSFLSSRVLFKFFISRPQCNIPVHSLGYVTNICPSSILIWT